MGTLPMTPQPERHVHLPGEPGTWIFVAADMFLFSLLMITFLYYRSLDTGSFAAGSLLLNREIAIFNTFLMITGSLLVSRAPAAARGGRDGQARLLIRLAALCGIFFAVAKAFEYREEVTHGLLTNQGFFPALYFAMTGLHLIHVAVAVGVLLFLGSVRGDPERRVSHIESGGLIWHVVDAVWMLLFALLYLLP